MHKTNKYRRYTKHIPTPDNFYPNFEDDTVEVSVSLTTELWKRPSIQFSVYGADDFGFERPRYFLTPKEARRNYDETVRIINNWSIVTIKQLMEMDFKRA